MELLYTDEENDPLGYEREKVLREGIERCVDPLLLSVLASLLSARFEATGDADYGHEATAIFERLHGADPDNPEPLRGLAFLEAVQGNDEQTIELARRARCGISLTDELGLATFWSLVWVLLRLPSGEEEALTWLETESRKHPDWAMFPLTQSLLLEESEPDRAQKLRMTGESLWRGSSKDLEGWLEERRLTIEDSRTAPKSKLA